MLDPIEPCGSLSEESPDTSTGNKLPFVEKILDLRNVAGARPVDREVSETRLNSFKNEVGGSLSSRNDTSPVMARITVTASKPASCGASSGGSVKRGSDTGCKPKSASTHFEEMLVSSKSSICVESNAAIETESGLLPPPETLLKIRDKV